MLEPHLTAHETLCAGRFTAADISVGYALLLATHLKLSDKFTPAVAAYWQRLQLREGYRRALKSQHDAATAQGIDTTPSPDLTAADISAASKKE